MDKQDFLKKLKDTASDPNMIPGIYNWCDRWCERCAFTQRCTNFQMQPDTDLDINSEEFWDEMSMIFSATMDLLKEMADERGIDLDEMEPTEEEQQREKEKDDLATLNDCALLARNYDRQVRTWFEQLAEKDPALLELREPDDKTKDCLEVIQWYQHFIFIKLQRAFHAREDEIDFEIEPQDSNGTAKVTLIAMDRSIGSWGVILQQFPEDEDMIVQLLATLQKLRRLTEENFPDARAFVRPGLDE